MNVSAIAYRGFAALGGEAGAKEAGKIYLEGKEYTAQDGGAAELFEPAWCSGASALSLGTVKFA